MSTTSRAKTAALTVAGRPTSTRCVPTTTVTRLSCSYSSGSASSVCGDVMVGGLLATRGRATFLLGSNVAGDSFVLHHMARRRPPEPIHRRWDDEAGLRSPVAVVTAAHAGR